MADISKITLLNGTTYDLKDAKARMVVLSYGSSTWAEFIEAYENHTVVYCRASSNSNPASGSQTRLAFMAYVNNATTPTEVEFQYYRSVSSHTDSQQGDQVFVYKLQSNGTWSVTTRDAFTKVIAGTGLSSTFSTGVHSTITLNNTVSYTAETSKLVTTTVPNVTSVGSAPTLGTAIPVDDITAWTSNTPTSASVSNGVLTISTGSAASLSYTAKSIPNVTSVGSAPTLGTAITVATGSLASNGSGGTVATGITAS